MDIFGIMGYEWNLDGGGMGFLWRLNGDFGLISLSTAGLGEGDGVIEWDFVGFIIELSSSSFLFFRTSLTSSSQG